MDKKYEDALSKCLDELVKTMPSILDMVLVKMNNYFLDQQQEMIRAQTTGLMKVVEFVKVLRTLENEAFFTFLDVLDQLHYRHVANDIRLAANVPIPQPPQGAVSSLSGAAVSMFSAPSMAPVVAGRENFLWEKPTMALAKQICDFIAAHWMDIAYCLDFDPDGNEVDLIEQEGNRNPKQCCMLMMKKWIQGNKGKQPKNWQTLLDILMTLDHKAAHDKVKGHLQHEQQKRAPKPQDSVSVSRPVEETGNGNCLPSLQPKAHSPNSLKRHMNNASLPHECDAHHPEDQPQN